MFSIAKPSFSNCKLRTGLYEVRIMEILRTLIAFKKNALTPIDYQTKPLTLFQSSFPLRVDNKGNIMGTSTCEAGLLSLINNRTSEGKQALCNALIHVLIKSPEWDYATTLDIMLTLYKTTTFTRAEIVQAMYATGALHGTENLIVDLGDKKGYLIDHVAELNLLADIVSPYIKNKISISRDVNIPASMILHTRQKRCDGAIHYYSDYNYNLNDLRGVDVKMTVKTTQLDAGGLITPINPNEKKGILDGIMTEPMDFGDVLFKKIMKYKAVIRAHDTPEIRAVIERAIAFLEDLKISIGEKVKIMNQLEPRIFATIKAHNLESYINPSFLSIRNSDIEDLGNKYKLSEDPIFYNRPDAFNDMNVKLKLYLRIINKNDPQILGILNLWRNTPWETFLTQKNIIKYIHDSTNNL